MAWALRSWEVQLSVHLSLICHPQRKDRLVSQDTALSYKGVAVALPVVSDSDEMIRMKH